MPDNILLSAGTAVITDFGIAKAVDAARTRHGAPGVTLTSDGLAIGTPAYMAPDTTRARRRMARGPLPGRGQIGIRNGLVGPGR